MDDKYSIERIPGTNLFSLLCDNVEVVKEITFGEAVIMLENMMYTTGDFRDD